ncbi:MAG: S-methyl-5'-thioadenosine phosphorylase [Pseudomonadota bacterium]
MTTEKRVIGVIGGSGLYDLDNLESASVLDFSTPWGAPSGPVTSGFLAGTKVFFLPRHGDGHRVPPNDVNYRANIDALKQAGITDLISISACGSFREELSPGTFVMIDQFIDRSVNRQNSFFGPGCVAHVSMAEPICPLLRDAACKSAAATDIPFVENGTYLGMEGPHFSSKAESHLYRSWGCDVIGMTNATEAKLAREAELPYASICMVTDYDCWHEEEKAVEVEAILSVMRNNTINAKRLLPDLIQRLGPARTSSPLGIETCLDTAIITPPQSRDPQLVAKLHTIAGRAFSKPL